MLQKIKDFIWTKPQTLTFCMNFNSNSFSDDQFAFGLEYSYKKMFMLRGGYATYNNQPKTNNYSNIYSGPSVGASYELGLGKSGSRIGIDYAYRVTYVLNGVHQIGVKFSL